MTDRAAPRDEALLAKARASEGWLPVAGRSLIQELTALAESQAARIRELEQGPRTDEDGCYTLANGDCIGCPHCIHGPKSYHAALARIAALEATQFIDGFN